MEGKFKIEDNTIKLYLDGSVKQIEIKGTLSFPWVDRDGKTHHLTEYQKFIAEYNFPKDKDTFICVGGGMGTTYALKLNESLKDRTKCYYGHTRLAYGFKPLFNDPCDFMLFEGYIPPENYREVKSNGHAVVSVMTPTHFKSIAGSLKGDYNFITWEHEFNPHIERNYISTVESLTEESGKRLKGSWED